MSWWIPAAIGAVSSLFGGKKQNVSAPPAPPPIPQAPAPVIKPREVAMPSLLSNPGQYADPMQGVLAQQVLGSVGNGLGLSGDYRSALRNEATSTLDLQRQRLQAQAAERMNSMGLLGSGALGVQSGMVDEEYMRSLLGVESTLAQQDVQEKARLQEMLRGFQQDSGVRSQYLGDLGMRYSGLVSNQDLGYAQMVSNQNLGVRGQDINYGNMVNQNNMAYYNAQNQAQANNAGIDNSRTASIFGNMMQGYNAYETNRNATAQRQMLQQLLDSRYGR